MNRRRDNLGRFVAGKYGDGAIGHAMDNAAGLFLNVFHLWNLLPALFFLYLIWRIWLSEFAMKILLEMASGGKNCSCSCKNL